MIRPDQWVCLLIGVLLPSLLQLLYRLIVRPSVYNDDRDVIALNTSLGETRWFNLGYWTSSQSTFTEAAAELCRRVAHQAQLKASARVLELGSGYGDGARLLASEFSPSSYLGITAVPGHHEHAVAAARRAGLSNSAFVAGDALHEMTSLPSDSFDCVLATDCAYHFNTRNQALREAFRTLKPGGTIGLTDLLLPSRQLALWERVALRVVCLLAGVPFVNLVPEQMYVAELERQGWREVKAHDISEHVYPGFLAFVESHGDKMGRALTAWPGLVMYARVLRWYSNPRQPRMRFYLISAKK